MVWRRLTELYADEMYRCDGFHQSHWRFTRYLRRDLWWAENDLKAQQTIALIPVFQFLSCDFCHTVYGGRIVAIERHAIGEGLHPAPHTLKMEIGGRWIAQSPPYTPPRIEFWANATPAEIEEIAHKVVAPPRLKLVAPSIELP